MNVPKTLLVLKDPEKTKPFRDHVLPQEFAKANAACTEITNYCLDIVSRVAALQEGEGTIDDLRLVLVDLAELNQVVPALERMFENRQIRDEGYTCGVIDAHRELPLIQNHLHILLNGVKLAPIVTVDDLIARAKQQQAGGE